MKTADFSWNLTDPETIRLNRQGQLSQRQQELLYRFTPWPIGIGLVYLFMLGLVTVPFWWPFEERLPAVMLPLYIVIFGFAGLLTVAFSLFYGWRAVVDRLDVRQGKIVGGHGVVSKTSNGYVASVKRATLRTLVRKIDLLPGNYYFYYLPRSRYLLSAESLEANPILGAVELRQELGQRFHFNENDLMLNRTGRLSGRQQLRLLIQAAGFGFLTLIVLIVGLPLIYIIIQNEQFGVISFQTAGLVLLFFLFLGWVGWSFLPRLADGILGSNRTIVGPVQIVYRGSGRSTQLYYAVHDLDFEVGYKDYYALVEGLIYQVHYTRWSKRIVSIEPVPQPSNI